MPLAAHAAQPTDFTIVAGQRVGFITKDTSEKDVRANMPKTEVSRTFYEESWAGETDGPLRCVTRLYPDSGRELWIIWKSDFANKWQENQLKACQSAPLFSQPAYVLLAIPESMTVETIDPSPWKTASGIGLGTNLDALEKANGKPVIFSVAPDTEGNVLNWNGGALASVMQNAMLTYKRDGIFARLQPFMTGSATAPEISSAALPPELKAQIHLALFTVGFSPVIPAKAGIQP